MKDLIKIKERKQNFKKPQNNPPIDTNHKQRMKVSVVDPTISIKDEIYFYWNRFAVTQSFRIHFSHLLKTFPDKHHRQLYEKELQHLQELDQLITSLKTHLSEKRKLLVELESYTKYINQIEAESQITSHLSSLRSNLIKLFELISKFRNSYIIEFQNGKYDISKMPVDYPNEIFEYVLSPKDKHISSLFDDLDFIKKGEIGNKFNIKENIDFILTKDNEINKLTTEDLMNMFNDMLFAQIHNGDNKRGLVREHNHLSAKQLKKIKPNDKKECIDAGIINGKIHKKEEKFTIVGNCKEDNEIKSKGMFGMKMKMFKKEKYVQYKGDIMSLKDTYEKYYIVIPQEQKITFNLTQSVFDLVKGVCPFVFVKYSEDGNICGMCTFSYVKSDLESIMINHLSNKENGVLKEEFHDIVACLNDNGIHYKTIIANLYWSYNNIDNKLILNEDIHSIFKALNFKWVDLENVDNTTRIQKMQMINRSYVNNKHSYIHSMYLTLESGLLLNKSSSHISNNNNTFLMSICNTDGEFINDLFTLKVKYINDSNQHNIISFLKQNSLNVTSCTNIINTYMPNNNTNPIKACLFKLPLVFDNMVTLTLNGKSYQRIETEIQMLTDEKTNQRLYHIETADKSSSIVLCEMNEMFRKKVLGEGSMYDNFYELFGSLESSDINGKINAIYLPMRCLFKKVVSFKEGRDGGIEGVDYYGLSRMESDRKENGVEIQPMGSDVILRGDIFISVMNTEIINDTNKNPTIFCGVIDNERT